MRSLIDEFREWWAGWRASHDITAYNCIYWTGDRAGAKLTAVCGVCAKEQF